MNHRFTIVPLLWILLSFSCGPTSSPKEECNPETEVCEVEITEEIEEEVEPVNDLSSCVAVDNNWRSKWKVQPEDDMNLSHIDGRLNVMTFSNLEYHEDTEDLEYIHKTISLTAERRALEFEIKGSGPGIVHAEVYYQDIYPLSVTVTVTNSWEFHSLKYVMGNIAQDNVALAIIDMDSYSGTIYIDVPREGPCTTTEPTTP